MAAGVNKYSVRRQALAEEARRRQQNAEAVSNTVTSALQQGISIVNTLGTSIGNEQAAK